MLKVMGGEFLNEFNKKRVKSNIALRVVWPRDKTVDVAKDVFLAPGKEVLRQTRLAPKEMDFSMGYWAYADKVMFLSSRAENFGFIVESRELRQLIKTQFEIVPHLIAPKNIWHNLSYTAVTLDKIFHR